MDRERDLCSGPGKLTQALAVGLYANDTDLSVGPVVIYGSPHGGRCELVQGPRIGITKATELPWRFCLAGSPYVSRPWPRVGTGRGAWLTLAGGELAAGPPPR